MTHGHTFASAPGAQANHHRCGTLLRAAAWLLALAPSCGGSALPPSAGSPLLGQQLPPLEARTLDGTKINASSLQGKTVVVKFFATYCEPCKKTLPEAERLHQALPEVVFVGISEDEFASQASELAKKYALSFPVVHDSGNSLSGHFRVRELPVTFVADSDSVVRWVGGPDQGESELARALDSVGH